MLTFVPFIPLRRSNSSHIPSFQLSSPHACLQSSAPSELVLTHATADFDSLGAAVGLARLRSEQCKVVIPSGMHPAVRRYLSLTKQLLPLFDARLVEPHRLVWVGVTDTASPKRLGTARDWLKHADVFVLDHHQPGVQGFTQEDVGGLLEVRTEKTGAVSTAVAEMVKERGLKLSAAEWTVLALGIHTDTGSLSYENTTPRDANALAWAMEKGACQKSIALYARNYLSGEQQRLLAAALESMKVERKHGLSVALVVLETETYVKGMAAVAQAALELAHLDALVLAGVSPSKNGMKQVSLIGRAGGRVEGVDFSTLFGPYGGGGHAKAASASLKMVDVVQVRQMLDGLIERVFDGLPPPALAGDFMSSQVLCVGEREKMSKVKELLAESGHTGLVVVNMEDLVKGVISRQDVAMAERRGKLETPVKGWMNRRMISVERDTPLYEVEAKLVDFNIGRVPVVDDGKVVGIITRSDVLLQRRLFGIV